MTFRLTDNEMTTLALVPDKALADLAADLNLLPDENIDRKALVEALLPSLLALGRREGLPFSKYDAEDLEELPKADREALARALGWGVEVRHFLRSGKRVYKIYRNERQSSQVPLMLPLLLPVLARFASTVDRG